MLKWQKRYNDIYEIYQKSMEDLISEEIRLRILYEVALTNMMRNFGEWCF